MFAFLRLIRWTNLLLIALCLSLFYYLLIVPAHLGFIRTTIIPFTHSGFIWFVISVLCIAASGNIINDYFDFELDKQFKPDRPLAKGTISLNMAVYLNAVFAFSGIALGFYLGWQAGNYKLGYVYVTCAVLLYLYSAYLKKVALLGNVLVAALLAFVFVLLMLFEAQNLHFLAEIHYENVGYVMNMLLLQLYFYGGFAFLTGLAREVIKDLEDMEGDATFDIQTLPVVYGETVAKVVAGTILLITIIAIAYFQKLLFEKEAMKHLYYLLIAVQLPTMVALFLLYKAKTPKQYHRLSIFVKAIMLLGILSMPVFYMFNKI